MISDEIERRLVYFEATYNVQLNQAILKTIKMSLEIPNSSKQSQKLNDKTPVIENINPQLVTLENHLIDLKMKIVIFIQTELRKEIAGNINKEEIDFAEVNLKSIQNHLNRFSQNKP